MESISELNKFVKDRDEINFKGAYIQGEYYDAAQITEIAGLPTKDELLSMLLSVLQANMRNLAYSIKQVAEKMPADGAAPAEPEAKTEEPAAEEVKEEAPAPEETPAEEPKAEEPAKTEEPAEEKPAEEVKEEEPAADEAAEEPAPEPVAEEEKQEEAPAEESEE